MESESGVACEGAGGLECVEGVGVVWSPGWFLMAGRNSLYTTGCIVGDHTHSLIGGGRVRYGLQTLPLGSHGRAWTYGTTATTNYGGQ